MTPKEFADDTIKELMINYGLDKGLAIEMAMFAINKALNCNGICTDFFLGCTMDELDDIRLTHK
jgi:hypothetical protein